MYYLAITFKGTEWVKQKIRIKFGIKLEYFSLETKIQKAIAMCNWWLASTSPQHVHLCITSCAEIFCEMPNHLGDLVPLQLQFSAVWFLALPKTKITCEKEGISDHRLMRFRKIRWAADGDWENCMRSPGAYFEGDWDVNVLCTMFLISRIFFNKHLYFSYYMTSYFLDRPYMFIFLSNF